MGKNVSYCRSVQCTGSKACTYCRKVTVNTMFDVPNPPSKCDPTVTDAEMNEALRVHCRGRVPYCAPDSHDWHWDIKVIDGVRTVVKQCARCGQKV